MRLRFSVIVAAVVFLLASGRGWALTIGDSAPALTVSSWVKGEPVTAFQKDKMYVVEFWATWCGPCKTSIPHLTEMAHKYKDVTFIGVSVWENKDADVAPFVKEMGEKMDYHVAMDDKSSISKGAMAVNWMDAAKQNGIPTAFIVSKEGKILWIGHPMTMDEPLQAITAGTYDMATAKAALDKQQQEAAMEERLNSEINAAVGPALAKKDYAAALKGIDEVIAKHPEGKNVLLGLKARTAIQAKQWDVGYATLDEYVAASKENASLLNAIAWDIATDPMFEVRDLERAQKYAQLAVDASQGKDPNILDTLARVYFDKGDKAKAIELEKKAIALAPAESQGEFIKTLTRYQAK